MLLQQGGAYTYLLFIFLSLFFLFFLFFILITKYIWQHKNYYYYYWLWETGNPTMGNTCLVFREPSLLLLLLLAPGNRKPNNGQHLPSVPGTIIIWIIRDIFDFMKFNFLNYYYSTISSLSRGSKLTSVAHLIVHKNCYTTVWSIYLPFFFFFFFKTMRIKVRKREE